MEEGKRGNIFVSCIYMERCPICNEWKLEWSEEYMLPFEEKNVKQQNAYISILLLQMHTEKLGNSLRRRTVARVISREGNSF